MNPQGRGRSPGKIRLIYDEVILDEVDLDEAGGERDSTSELPWAGRLILLKNQKIEGIRRFGLGQSPRIYARVRGYMRAYKKRGGPGRTRTCNQTVMSGRL